MGKNLVTGLALLLVAAQMVGATSTVSFLSDEAHVVDGAIGDGQHSLLELRGDAEQAATWQGQGASATLHVQGEDKDEFVGFIGEGGTPVDETESFTDWSLDGGEWRSDYHVLIGTTSDQVAHVSFAAVSASAVAADVRTPLEQEARFSHEVDAVRFNPSDSIAWQDAEFTDIRIEGDFTVTAWSADMILGDTDSEPELFHSGSQSSTQEGAEGAEDVAYTTHSRINNLYVEDGWLELRIQTPEAHRLFMADASIALDGTMTAPQTRLLDGDRSLAEGELATSGPAEFDLNLATTDSALDIEPTTPSTSWAFDDVPIYNAKGDLMDSKDLAARLGTTLADPSEGHWPAWAKITAWSILGIGLVAVFELTGVGPLGRAQFYLATYRYDGIRAHSNWKWYPPIVRSRMYFNAALAAAGREDHQAALDYATSIPLASRWSNAGRFVAIQSMAALGHDMAAELAFDELSQSDPRYRTLASENPFLRHIAQR